MRYLILVLLIATCIGVHEVVRVHEEEKARLVNDCFDYQLEVYGDVLGEVPEQDGYNILKQSKILIIECVEDGGPPE